MESVILQTPAIIILLVIALALMLASIFFSKVLKAAIIPSMIIFATALTYALLVGAELMECAVVCTLFFILSLAALLRGGGK